MRGSWRWLAFWVGYAWLVEDGDGVGLRFVGHGWEDTWRAIRRVRWGLVMVFDEPCMGY